MLKIKKKKLNMKNILMLTPLYPASDLPTTDTPIVHYFTKEWVKQGYNVLVMHYITKFPKIYYRSASVLKNFISSKVGFIINTQRVEDEKEYELDGVNVVRISLKKYIPHRRFSREEVSKAFNKTIYYCNRYNFKPDCIIGHWIMPQLELLAELKKVFCVPTALVLHGSSSVIKSNYKNDGGNLINSLDIIGFRSNAIKRNYEQNVGHIKPYFMCYSGMPKELLGTKVYRNSICLRNFIYVGTLIKRKFPLAVIESVSKVYSKEDEYHVNYIGEGGEVVKIKEFVKQNNLIEKVQLLGRLPKAKVQEELKRSDVFIMISKNEAFGLVYLEAMAAGCITIAARNEGFDGIIQDGKNGFLCEAGNVDELASILEKIKNMSEFDLISISKAAMDTAFELTESKVAASYINAIKNKN